MIVIKFPPAKTDESQDLPAPADEVKLEYQPEMNTSKLREFLKQHASLLGLLTIISPVFFGIFAFVFFLLFHGVASLFGQKTDMAAFGQLYMLPMYGGLLLFPLTIPVCLKLFKIVFQPTHLLIRADGIYLQWQQRLKRPVKALVRWTEINYVDLCHVTNKTKESEQYLLFKTADLPPGKEKKIKLSGFLEASGRGELLKAIRKWAPDLPRNPEVNALLEPPPQHAYTELWLNALTASPERESLTPLKPGTQLKNGSYEIIAKIAVGGQGTAYAAECSNKNETAGKVVLKEYVLPTHVGLRAKNESIEVLKNEAEILARLSHPNVVKLLDYFVEDHRGYLVLEHIEGTNLRDLIGRFGPLPEAEVRRLALQMCDTLAFLHDQTPPVVHRDFSPENLILTTTGELKLIDFNVARQTASTVTATVVGKHAYIPLEQFRGKPVPQSDIFALGCILHYLLTARDPEPLSTSSPRNIRPELSEKMNAIVEKATQLDCAARYTSAQELAEDLRALPIS